MLICELCLQRKDMGQCICPACIECGRHGETACYEQHGMQLNENQFDSRASIKAKADDKKVADAAQQAEIEAESIADNLMASELVKKLQEKIKKHGDHKICLYDSIADENISFSGVGIQFRDGSFVVAPESMTGGDEEYLFARKVIRDARDEIAQQSNRMLKIIEAINQEYPDLDEDKNWFRSTHLKI